MILCPPVAKYLNHSNFHFGAKRTKIQNVKILPRFFSIHTTFTLFFVGTKKVKFALIKKRP